jgi:hypothetical protein
MLGRYRAGARFDDTDALEQMNPSVQEVCAMVNVTPRVSFKSAPMKLP